MKDTKSFPKKLNAWYRRQARDLPWRRTADPYKIWISEVMLQQTTVNATIPYYERWVRKFPTIRHVARAPLSRILKTWQGLGYYQRARNLHKSAKLICEQFDGKVPDNPEQLQKLPGFGPYTVGAVLSIAFNKRAVIVDANVRRVMMRLLAIEGHPDSTKDAKIKQRLEEVLPSRGVGTFNQALMELGALVCRNREPLCLLCPVREECLAYKKGIQELIPQVKKKKLKDLDVVIAVIHHNGHYFIQQRPPTGLLANLWEFPGGKVERGESKKNALKREIKEELGIELVSAKPSLNLIHFYTSFRVRLHVFDCQPKSYPAEGKKQRWVNLRRLGHYPMPSGSAKIVEHLLASRN